MRRPAFSLGIRALIAADRVAALSLESIGFVFYDVDIAFKQYARAKGIRLERPESLNGSSTLASAIADLARQGLQRLRS